jgi:hypothetical protein
MAGKPKHPGSVEHGLLPLLFQQVLSLLLFSHG